MCLHVVTFSSSVTVSYIAFQQVGESARIWKLISVGRPQDFLSCQLQNIPSSSVTSFLLVALMAITDLFLKLGADISKTAITPSLLLLQLKRKMVLNLGIQLGKARRWARRCWRKVIIPYGCFCLPLVKRCPELRNITIGRHWFLLLLLLHSHFLGPGRSVKPNFHYSISKCGLWNLV